MWNSLGITWNAPGRVVGIFKECYNNTTILGPWFEIFLMGIIPIWGRFPFWLYNISQMGWNHQLEYIHVYKFLTQADIIEQEAQKHTGGPTHTDILRESYHVKQANRLPFRHHWFQYTFLMLIDTTLINYWRWDSCSTPIMRSFQDTPGLGRAGIFCRKHFYLSWSHLSNEKKTGWLGYTRP